MKALRVDRAKVVDYLLNPAKSRGKSVLFLQMGFRADHWEVLAQALKTQAESGDISSVVESPYGARYCVDGVLQSVDDGLRERRFRTVWIEEHGLAGWRLITAYPL